MDAGEVVGGVTGSGVEVVGVLVVGVVVGVEVVGVEVVGEVVGAAVVGGDVRGEVGSEVDSGGGAMDVESVDDAASPHDAMAIVPSVTSRARLDDVRRMPTSYHAVHGRNLAISRSG